MEKNRKVYQTFVEDAVGEAIAEHGLDAEKVNNLIEHSVELKAHLIEGLIDLLQETESRSAQDGDCLCQSFCGG